jgi:hypothetical protein
MIPDLGRGSVGDFGLDQTGMLANQLRQMFG